MSADDGAPTRSRPDRTATDDASTRARPDLATAEEIRAPFLFRLNPLAKLLGTLVAIVALFFTTGLAAPITWIVLALVLLLVGGPRGVRHVIGILVVPAVVAAILSVTLGVWAASHVTAGSAEIARLGPIVLYVDGWWQGLATALRLVAIAVLAYLGGATTESGDFVRSLIAQLRVPYRIGYAALASFRFVPRFRAELATIRRAHRARGVSLGRGPVGAVRRWLASVVPLIAGSIRHAERVALSMDARAFGFADARTERHPVPWRTRDTVFVIASALATAAITTAALAG